MTAPVALATDELVGIAWLRTITALDGIPISTSLAGGEGGAAPLWQSTGKRAYVQVAVAPLGLPPDPYFPAHRPRLVCSCWALPKRWGTAAQVAQQIRAASYDPTLSDVVLAIADGYEQVRVAGVQVMAEPTRVPGGDVAELARYDVPLLVEWMSVYQ